MISGGMVKNGKNKGKTGRENVKQIELMETVE